MPISTYTLQQFHIRRKRLRAIKPLTLEEAAALRDKRRINCMTWGVGALAELKVEVNLQMKLQGRYRIVPDFQVKDKGNIDIIVITSDGIFCIEIKGSHGLVSFHEDELFINGKFPLKSHLRQVYAEYKTLFNLLPLFPRICVPIIPILEFPYGQIDRKTIPHDQVWTDIRIGGFGTSVEVIQRQRKNILSLYAIEKIHDFLLLQQKALEIL